VDITLFLIINGISSTILVFISVLVGIRIIIKYFESKRREFIFFGCTWILIVQPWYPSMVSFFVALFGGELTLTQYLWLEITIPFSLLFGIAAVTELLYKESQKLLVFVFIIIEGLFEIVFIFLLINDPTVIGTLKENMIIYGVLTKIFIYTMLGVILVAGILFTKESAKSDEPEIRLKGKILTLAFFLFTIGTIIEVSFTPEIVLFFITRPILIASALTFYWGFFLPNFLKKRI
jgi:hypothetical protein